MPGDREKLQEDEEEEGGLCSPARRPRTLLWALLACLGTLAIVGTGRDTLCLGSQSRCYVQEPASSTPSCPPPSSPPAPSCQR